MYNPIRSYKLIIEEDKMKKRTLIALSVSVCLLAAGCTSTTTNTNSNSSKKSDKVTEGSSEIATTEAETETESESIYNIGDTAILKDWEINLTDMKIVESIAANYGSFSPKEEGNKYIQVFLNASNKGKEADTFCPSYGFGDDISVKVLYGDGYEFTATNLLGYDNDIHDSKVNPLSSQTGEIAFEIPDTVASTTDELIVQFSSGNDVVKFKVR